MKCKIGILFMLIGVILILFATVISFYNLSADNHAETYSNNVLEIIENDIPKLSEAKQIDYLSEETTIQQPVIDVLNKEYIGIIHIPSINIKLPVMSSCSENQLKLTPCCYSGTANDDSLIIAGHNYSSHFGNIDDLNQNDEVYFINANGEIYSYIVLETEIIDDSDIEGMQQGNWDLSLFTCNFTGDKRITIRCIRQ